MKVDISKKPLLGLGPPWYVLARIYQRQIQALEIRVVGAGPLWDCSRCGQRLPARGYEERRWRHLDSDSYQTWVSCPVPVVQCPVHHFQPATVPWADPSSPFTRHFEYHALDLLRKCPVQSASEILKISQDEADYLKKCATQRNPVLKTKPKAIPAPRWNQFTPLVTRDLSLKPSLALTTT